MSLKWKPFHVEVISMVLIHSLPNSSSKEITLMMRLFPAPVPFINNIEEIWKLQKRVEEFWPVLNGCVLSSIWISQKGGASLTAVPWLMERHNHQGEKRIVWDGLGRIQISNVLLLGKKIFRLLGRVSSCQGHRLSSENLLLFLVLFVLNSLKKTNDNTSNSE